MQSMPGRVCGPRSSQAPTIRGDCNQVEYVAFIVPGFVFFVLTVYFYNVPKWQDKCCDEVRNWNDPPKTERKRGW